MVTNEAKTETVRHWLGSRSDHDLAISDWTVTEFSAALSIKRRRGEIGEDVRSSALNYFLFVMEHSFTIYAVSRRVFVAASKLADQEGLKLRAGDALHLGICVEVQADLLTLDRVMHTAALAVGLRSELI